MPVTDLDSIPPSWCVGLWRASLAVEELPECHTVHAWLQALGDRVVRAMPGLTMVANSQAGPSWVCQREGMQGSAAPQLALLRVSVWPYLMVLETEGKWSIQSQKCGPCLPRASISFHFISSHLISSHLVSSRLISSHLISSHLISSHLISSHLISSHLTFLFFWDKGTDSPKCLPGDQPVPPAEGLDTVGVRLRLQQTVSPALILRMWLSWVLPMTAPLPLPLVLLICYLPRG